MKPTEMDRIIQDLAGDVLFGTPYQASQIKRRRATRDEIEVRRAGLHGIIATGHPMTVRQVFYQATVHGIIEKSENGYNKVQTDLVKMRRDGSLPYGWLTDSTRWQRKQRSFDTLADAIDHTASFYRRSLWTDADCQVEIWIEKDALAGVVYPVTNEWDVPLMVARGYASLSFLHSAAEAINEDGRTAYIYHLGDFDPSGVNAGEKIEEALREMTGDVEIHFERLAVTPQQIRIWNLPTRPTKRSDSRAKNFGSDLSVELDAIPPDRLRSLVSDAIERHVDPEQLRVILAAEASEKDFLKRWRGQFDTQ
ncbi:hypothetical protein [Sinorhizobium meliloti]|nr:hypothetical protein [Sinorhizobium meliloti]